MHIILCLQIGLCEYHMVFVKGDKSYLYTSTALAGSLTIDIIQ